MFEARKSNSCLERARGRDPVSSVNDRGSFIPLAPDRFRRGISMPQSIPIGLETIKAHHGNVTNPGGGIEHLGEPHPSCVTTRHLSRFLFIHAKSLENGLVLHDVMVTGRQIGPLIRIRFQCLLRVFAVRGGDGFFDVHPEAEMRDNLVVVADFGLRPIPDNLARSFEISIDLVYVHMMSKAVLSERPNSVTVDGRRRGSRLIRPNSHPRPGDEGRRRFIQAIWLTTIKLLPVLVPRLARQVRQIPNIPISIELLMISHDVEELYCDRR